MSSVNLKQVIKKNIKDTTEGLYTNLPASVVEYDPETQTCSVQTLINYTFPDGFELQDAVIAGVPVIFPSAGGGIISFPVQRGDTVLLCFSMRSIDKWVEEGGQSTPDENRLHDLNDAIAIPGLYPKPQSKNPSPDNVEIQFKGNRVVLRPDGTIEIEGGRIDLGANAGDSVVLGDSFQTLFNSHTHPDPTSGSTGVPVQQMGPTHLSNKVFTE